MENNKNNKEHELKPNIDYIKTIEVFKDIITKQQDMIFFLITKQQESNLNILPMLSGLLSDKIHVMPNPGTIPFPNGPWGPNTPNMGMNFGPTCNNDNAAGGGGVNYSPPPPKLPADSSTLNLRL